MSMLTASRRLRHLQTLRPRNPEQLHRFVSLILGLRVPRKPVVAGHSAPFEYLEAAFFETGGDLVVWASRGGGKTMLGAAATLLDLVFKPGIQVRLLGGSLEQSQRMYRYLVGLCHRPHLCGLLAEEPTQRRLLLPNGSEVEVLSQSERSVRGLHVHKLRCDEVEEFEPDVWRAAQLVTRSGLCGAVMVHGTVEALSTLHRPYGLMQQVIEGVAREGSGKSGQGSAVSGQEAERRSAEAAAGAHVPLARVPMGKEAGASVPSATLPAVCVPTVGGAPANVPVPHPSDPAAAHGELANATLETRNAKLIRWSALDVVARCPEERRCAGCALARDCEGRAKTAAGFVAVEDLLRQRHRSDDTLWEAEMLCHRPQRHTTVYPKFNVARHVRATAVPQHGPMARTPPARGTLSGQLAEPPFLIAGMDFGVRACAVVWARVTPAPDTEDGASAWIGDALVEVLGAYQGADETLESNLTVAEGRGLPAEVEWIGVDPAGGQRNSHTGLTDLDVLRRRGYTVLAQTSRLHEGINLIRRRLERDALVLSPRCAALIDALSKYHFDPRHPEDDQPVKDGPDHLCDALRYLLVNLESGGGAGRKRGY